MLVLCRLCPVPSLGRAGVGAELLTPQDWGPQASHPSLPGPLENSEQHETPCECEPRYRSVPRLRTDKTPYFCPVDWTSESLVTELRLCGTRSQAPCTASAPGSGLWPSCFQP